MPIHHHLSSAANLRLIWQFLLLIVCLAVPAAYLVRLSVSAPPSWLVWSEGRRMQFRKSVAARRVAPVALGTYGLLAVFALVLMATQGGESHPAAVFLLAENGLFFFGLGAYSSGPGDTRLDGEQRTYERVDGWPWKPRTRVWSLDEFGGVCVGRKYPVSVMLLRKAPGTWGSKVIVVDSLKTPNAAQAMAERVSQATGLPIVPYPR